MNSVVVRLLRVLSRAQLHRLVSLQVMIILMSIFEVVGVLSIGPFMAVATNVSTVNGSNIISLLYEVSGVDGRKEFIIWLGMLSLFLLSFASFLSIITSWRLMRTGEVIGAELSTKLFMYYVSKPWSFHSQVSSSQLVKNISVDCVRITQNIVYPALQVNAKIVLITVMGFAVFLMSPLVMLVSLSVFSLVYGVIFIFVKMPLSKMGKTVSELSMRRFKLMSEGFSGIKDVLLYHRQDYFLRDFGAASMEVAKSQSNISIIGVVPRYVMEFVSFGIIIILVMYLVGIKGDEDVIPVLSVVALAGMKLLPAFQYVYMAQSQIRGSTPSFEAIEDDLLSLRSIQDNSPGVSAESRLKVHVRESISLENIRFSYPGKSNLSLNNISMEFEVNKSIGLVGASGAGKSTAVDLIIGLVRPDAGEIKIDGEFLSDEMVYPWQENIGYVPQSIFLLDSSIAENIAFGIPIMEVSEAKVMRAAKLAHLDEFVEKLPEGYQTVIGERGVQLSGGQRQRIGIARALYNDPPVLIFDEATSALDGITEKLIMDAINEFSGKKTVIVIAHRLATVKNCDRVYLLDAGIVVDFGTYDELIIRNDKFKKMALA